MEVVQYSWGITLVEWGIASVLWRVFSTFGGYLQYMQGDSISTVGVFSTLGEDFKFPHVWPLKTTKRYRYFCITKRDFHLEVLKILADCMSFNPIRPGGGGAQRPEWPNSKLPIRNLLSNDAQTWSLLVFILEIPFGHILAKLVNQGGCCCSFLIETSQKF